MLFVYKTDKDVKRVFFNGNDKQMRYPNTTRWNSGYYAYVNMDKLHSHLIHVASQLANVKEIQMNVQDWEMLADMITILTMFADITDEIQRDGATLYTVYKLFNTIIFLITSHIAGKKYKTNEFNTYPWGEFIKNNIMKRYENNIHQEAVKLVDLFI